MNPGIKSIKNEVNRVHTAVKDGKVSDAVVGAKRLFQNPTNTTLNQRRIRSLLEHLSCDPRIARTAKDTQERLGFPNTKSNPLLDPREYPLFSQIKPEHAVPAVKEAIRKGRRELEQVLQLLNSNTPLTFNNTLKEFMEIQERLLKVSESFQNLYLINRNDAMQEAYEQIIPHLTKFLTKFDNDTRVYTLIKRYSQTNEAKSLTGPKKRLLEQTLEKFKYLGAELNNTNKARYLVIEKELAKLGSKFMKNKTDSRTDIVITDVNELQGLPPHELENLKQNAEETRNELIKTLQVKLKLTESQAETIAKQRIPENSYLVSCGNSDEVMQYVDNQELRMQLYFMLNQRGTNKATRGVFAITGKQDSLDNTATMQRILELRIEQATLVGCSSHADLQLKTDRMAKSPKEVMKFLTDLATQVQTKAQQDYDDLLKFQREINYQNIGSDPTKIMPWDLDYLENKFQIKNYSLDSQEVKQYFQFNNVLNTMLELASKLFSIEFVRNSEADKWDPNIQVYDVIDSQSKNKLGCFYLDAFKREGKEPSGAFASSVRNRSINKDGTINLPQVSLACNFSKPNNVQPSLLSHDEVTDLFHEFGHGLHSLLSEAELSDHSGFDGVVQDFTEVPSQFLENFAWEPSILKAMGKHYQTHETLPETMIEKMLAVRNYNRGLSLIRQLIFSLLDMELHMQSSVNESAMEIYERLNNKFSPFKHIPDTFFPNRFDHLYEDDGYSAGFYSYAWSKVLEADLFSKFHESGNVINPELGMKFRKEILAPGDAEDATVLTERFLGRKPNDTAFLVRNGLLAA